MSGKYKIYQTDGGLGFIDTIGISSPLTAEQKLAAIRAEAEDCRMNLASHGFSSAEDAMEFELRCYQEFGKAMLQIFGER